MNKYRLLVIDDSNYIFKAVKFALEPQGFEIIGHAENGKVGVEMCEKLSPDIITLDVTMPIMDGMETATYLFEKKIKIKTIMMSAMFADALKEQAMKVGVHYFLPKPFKSEDLVFKVLECLSESN